MKTYVKPEVEKINFSYKEQIVASGNEYITCTVTWENKTSGTAGCTYIGSENYNPL